MKSTRIASIYAVAAVFLHSFAIPLEAQQPSTKYHHYQLIDLGTFGGPLSYINAEFNSVPALNSRGITVGGSATSVRAPANTNPFGCLGPDGDVPFIFHSFELKDGMVTDLGALSPHDQNCSNAQAINARGQIAGTSENGLIDPVTGFIEDRAVLWENGNIFDLGTLGGPHSIAFGINDRAQIVGWSLNSVPDSFSILDLLGYQTSNGTQTRAFMWEHDQMQDLGTLGGPDALAMFINQHGQITGASYTNSTPNPTTGLPTLDPFLWQNGTMIDLGTLGGTLGSPLAINNAGQVIGTSNLAGDQTEDPFLWDKGNLIDLATNTIGATVVTANAINDGGEIVGAAVFAGAPYDAYLWRKGEATDLGHLNGDLFSEAIAINSRGDAIGYSTFQLGIDGVHPVLWNHRSPIDLNTTIPPDSSLTLVVPIAINAQGEIAGVGVPPGVSPNDVNTRGHAFLLIPCDGNHPGIEGCDYSLMDGSVAGPEGLAQMPLITSQGPGFGAVANPSLQRFGLRLGRWRRGIAQRISSAAPETPGGD